MSYIHIFFFNIKNKIKLDYEGGSIQYIPTSTMITEDWPCAFLFKGNAIKGINSYKKMHQEGTQYDDAKNTFDGKSLRFFFANFEAKLQRPIFDT